MPETQTLLTAHGLLKMQQSELDDLFQRCPAGPIPNGQAKGTAIIAPGKKYSMDIAELINHFGWQGKTFDGPRGVLSNRLTAFGINAIIADVYKSESWFDGKECIVLDYSKTSLIAQWIRDEIRLVQPGLYLGIVYWQKTKLIDFCLEFPATPAA